MSSVPPVATPTTGITITTQMEVPREHGTTQAPSCRVCLSFLSGSDGSSEHTCGRCAQVELFSMVAELQEVVDRLSEEHE